MQTKTNSDLMEKIINAILNQNATLFGSNPKVEFAYSTLTILSSFHFLF